MKQPLSNEGAANPKDRTMSKVLVLYYSSYGHMEQMADAVAEGARGAGAQVDIRRVPETAPAEVVAAAGFKADTLHPVIESPEALTQYDAIIVGSPTRFGRMASQMASFWDTAGGLWARGALNGKVGGAFASTATQHGGQETTLFSIITNLMHFGMTVVGLNYGHAGQMRMDELVGGAPYGATTLAGGDGSRQPSETDLEGARYQGRQIAELANKIAAPSEARELETA
jgi:NAD(P)H dehydrogenase (quinone)